MSAGRKHGCSEAAIGREADELSRLALTTEPRIASPAALSFEYRLVGANAMLQVFFLVLLTFPGPLVSGRKPWKCVEGSVLLLILYTQQQSAETGIRGLLFFSPTDA